MQPDRLRLRAKEGSRCFRQRPRREQGAQRRDEGERLVDHDVMLALGDFDVGRARRDETQQIVGVIGLKELRLRAAWIGTPLLLVERRASYGALIVRREAGVHARSEADAPARCASRASDPKGAGLRLGLRR